MKKVNLHISEPCHEDWDQMAPAERGHFCVTDIDGDYTITGPAEGLMTISYTGYMNVEKKFSAESQGNNTKRILDIQLPEIEFFFTGDAITIYQRNTLANVARIWWQSRAWIRTERKAERIARRAERSVPTPVHTS